MPMILNVARRPWLLGAMAVLFASSLIVAPAQADNTKKTLESLGKMLKDGGFKAKLDGNSYTLVFTTKSGYEFPIIITVTDDVLVMVSYIAPAEKITRPAGIEAGLLAANVDYRFLKILFDKKGNLIFRYDAFENMIDADDLKKLIDAMVENTVNFYTNAPWIKK